MKIIALQQDNIYSGDLIIVNRQHPYRDKHVKKTLVPVDNKNLIHPVMIVLVRGFAKGVNLQQLFIDNSIVHFMAVAVSSFAVANLLQIIMEGTNKNKPPFKKVSSDRAWAEINLENLRNNVKVLCEALPNERELMAVVKANAYGHGDVEIGRYLNLMDINSFAVATIDEGIRLRTHGIKGDICQKVFHNVKSRRLV